MQTKAQKQSIVSDATVKAKEAKALVFANFKGVSVADMTGIRRELAKSGSSWQVLKKTLLGIALKDAGIGVDTRALEGQVGVAFSADEVAAAKVLSDFIKAKKNTELSIVGGVLGTETLSVEAVKALAKLPSRDEMRAKVVSTLQAPISGFVRTLAGNVSGLVRILGAIRDGKTA